MVARRSQDADHRYLVTCRACGASNPINAGACWHCEQVLPERGSIAASPWRHTADEPPVAPADTPQHDPRGVGPPSFFPVLRDEVAGEAANDEPDAASPPSAPRRTWVGGVVALAVAAAVAVLLPAGLVDDRAEADRPVAERAHEAPPPLAPADARRALPTDETARVLPVAAPQREPAPAPTAAQRPVAPVAPADRVPGRIRSRTPAADATAAPPPPPVKAPCTPNVAALGLCSASP